MDCVAGTYSGPFEVTITLIDEIMGSVDTTTCTGTAEAVVALAGDPQVQGEWTCTVPDEGDVSDTWEGAVDESTASGELFVPGVVADWTGTFDGYRGLDVVIDDESELGPALTVLIVGEMALERE